MALSDIVQSELETELGVNDLYAALSAAEKLQKSNTAIQEINNMSVAALEADYLMDNMSSSTPIVVGSGSLVGIEIDIDSATGVEIVFDSAYPAVINVVDGNGVGGDYFPQAVGLNSLGEKVNISWVMKPDRITFYPDADATNIFYSILPLT